MIIYVRRHLNLKATQRYLIIGLLLLVYIYVKPARHPNGLASKILRVCLGKRVW